jgi:hypothetical protein
MSEIAIIGIGAVNDRGMDINELYENMELSMDNPKLLKLRKAIPIWEQLRIPQQNLFCRKLKLGIFDYICDG